MHGNPTQARLAMSRALALALLLMAGCPWPRSHPADQRRCSPACPAGQRCRDGVCGPADDGGTDLGGDLGADQGPACPSSPPAPTLGKLPQSTNHLQLAIRGTALAADRVTVSGGAKAPVTAKVAGGAWCAVVTLKAVATPQTFKVVATDKNGCSGPAAVASVSYSKSLKIVNVLYGIKGKSHAAPVKGTLASLTDGKVDQTVLLSAPTSSSFCEPTGYNYVWFDLGAVRTVDELDLRYPTPVPSTDYLSCWLLLGSTKASPAPPTGSATGDWTKLYSSNKETATATVSVDIFDTKVRHLAVVMFEDGDIQGNPEYVKLVEIEGWGLPSEPTCP